MALGHVRRAARAGPGVVPARRRTAHVRASAAARPPSSPAARSSSASATATAAPPVAAAPQQQLRGTWAYRLLDRVSLAAQRLEQIEAEQRQRQQTLPEAPAATAAAATNPNPDDDDDDVGATLDRIFEEDLEPIFLSRGGYRIPPRERRELDASGGSATYGEVLPSGVRAIARGALALDAAALLAASAPSSSSSSSSSLPRPPPPVFVDLGCGTGRAVMQVAGEFPGIARAVGIELGPTRLEQAEAALELLLKEQRRPPLAPVEFVLADLRECDLAATGGTHFYACTTAFNAALCRSLAERLCRSCPSFRVLATTRALPTQPHLVLLGRVEGVEYSWTGRGACYVYARSAEDAPPEVLARLWGGGGGGGNGNGGSGTRCGAVALPSASPLALRGLVSEEPMLAAMEAAAVRKEEEENE